MFADTVGFSKAAIGGVRLRHATHATPVNFAKFLRTSSYILIEDLR